jgi:peptidoglycan-binding protein ArfA
MSRCAVPLGPLPCWLALLLLGCAGGAPRRPVPPAAAPAAAERAAHALADLDARVATALPGCDVRTRAGAVYAVVPAARLFEPDTTTLRAAGGLDLSALAQLLRGCRGCVTAITVYTDAIGPADANLQFSAARAAALVARLHEAGVAVAHLHWRGAGEGEPIASQDTPSGRQANRRVEIVIRP